MSKIVIDECHICGQNRELTWEHIPPKSSGNNRTVKYYYAFDIPSLNGNSLETAKPHKKDFHISQGGLKFRTLCSDCNNFTGANYVTAYSDFAVQLQNGLRNIRQAENLNKSVHFNRKIIPLNFLKEVLALFCSILPYYTVQKYRFSDFVLNKEMQKFPDDEFDLYMYVSTTENGLFKFTPSMVVYNTVANGFFAGAEISAPPMGFLLLFKSDQFKSRTKLPLPSIKLMNRHSYNEEVEYSFDLPLLKPSRAPFAFEHYSLFK